MKHIQLTKFNKSEIFRVCFFYEAGIISYRYQPTGRVFGKQSGDLEGVYFKNAGFVSTRQLHVFSNTIQDGAIKGLFNELLNPAFCHSFDNLFTYYESVCSSFKDWH